MWTDPSLADGRWSSQGHACSSWGGTQPRCGHRQLAALLPRTGLPGLAPALRMAWAQVPCGRVQAGISLDLAALGLGERCLCIRTRGRQASFCLTGPCQCLRGGRCGDYRPRKSPHHQQGAAVAPNDQTFAAMEKSYCFQGPG